MARTELIRELEIRKKEIYSEIKCQLPDLIEELNAIDKIIGSNIVSASANITGSSTVSGTLTAKKYVNGTPKGSRSWMDYVLFMLNEIGGSGKSRDVAKAIANANPEISLQRAINASQDKLSRLLGSDKIKAIKPLSKKDGYIFEIL